MKLLIITQKYDINDSNLGAFAEWWDKLSEKMDFIYILALEKQSEPSKSNIKVIGMGKEKGAGFFGKIFGFYSGLLKTIGKTDAILVHMIPKYVILAAPVAFVYRKPIYMWYTGVAAHWQLRLAVLFCKKVFTAHPAAMRIDTPKRIITGHGIDTDLFRIISTMNRRGVGILSVGRITPSKGHDIVMRAVADLVKSGYDLNLEIVGGVIQDYHAGYAEGLKKLAADLKIENRVKFTGAVSYAKMPEIFRSAEIMINAVPFGGLDKVVLEAMASGVVPLTSNRAFASVFPASAADNLIFKSGDSEDLKSKLKSILDEKPFDDESFRRELRSIVVKNHNLDSLISKMVHEMKL